MWSPRVSGHEQSVQGGQPGLGSIKPPCTTSINQAVNRCSPAPAAGARCEKAGRHPPPRAAPLLRWAWAEWGRPEEASSVQTLWGWGLEGLAPGCWEGARATGLDRGAAEQHCTHSYARLHPEATAGVSHQKGGATQSFCLLGTSASGR